jgi:tetratricopeptide (TPR) repeat protein
MIEQLARSGKKDSQVPQAWSGMNMFRDHQLRYDDANRLHTYDNFRGNLADILRAGRRAGVPVILSTVASNLKDCAPFASLHAAKLTDVQKTEWENYFGEGTAFETNGEFQAALGAYAKAASLDSEYAELAYRVGRCHLALTNKAQALKDFETARDYDALGFRADSRINGIIKDAAAADKNVSLVDAVEILGRASANGICGQELFYEHVHLDFAGNYLLARAFADAAEKTLPPAIAARKKGEWAGEEICERALGVSPWDRYRLWEMNYSRVSEPPFTEQLNDVPRAKMYMAKLDELRGGMTGPAAEESRTMYAAALKSQPEDYFLHENFSQFLDGIGDLTHAVEEQKRVCELLPCYPASFYKAGLLLLREGNTMAAANCFSNAMALRDDYIPALNELALIEANQGKTNEAETFFARALKLNPGYVDTYFNSGFIAQVEGHLDEAIARYQTAAKIQPNGPAAYFCQAVMEAAQHHRDEAINYFHAALTMYPIFWQAHYLLGEELAAGNNVNEATEEFAAVVRSRPDFARGHLYLGVSLARQGKFDEAMKEFQTTLQLDPGNEAAKKYIGQVQAVKAQNKG